MKNNKFSVVALLIGLTAIAFSPIKQLDTPDCTSTLIFFKVAGSFTSCDLAASSLSFPIHNDAAHVSVTTRAAQPFACNNTSTGVCAIGYDATEVSFHGDTQEWYLVAGKTNQNYRCCVKKSL